MKPADALKSSLEETACPLHDIRPIIELHREGIKIICCCADFHKQCVAEAERLSGELQVSAKIIGE
jgi:hypothetical protein